VPAALTTALAVASTPPDGAVLIATFGAVEYPAPPPDTTIEITPLDAVLIPQVAAAPVPPPPLIQVPVML